MSHVTAGESLTPKAREDIVFRPLADEWVLFDPRRRLLHVLNHTAALVWTSCDGATTLDDVMAAIETVFEQPPAREAIERDVLTALERFRAEELLA